MFHNSFKQEDQKINLFIKKNITIVTEIKTYRTKYKSRIKDFIRIKRSTQKVKNSQSKALKSAKLLNEI